MIQFGECPMVVSLRLYVRRSSLVARPASRAHSFGLCTCSSLRIEERMLTRCTFASFRYALSRRATFLLYPHMARLFGINSFHWRPYVRHTEFAWHPSHRRTSKVGGVSICLATIGSKETSGCSVDGRIDDRFRHHQFVLDRGRLSRCNRTRGSRSGLGRYGCFDIRLRSKYGAGHRNPTIDCR